MQTDYYRSEITRVIKAGPAKDEEFFRVKVFGSTDSRFLNVNADQLRTLADAMDETNPRSLLPMHNGSNVIRADIETRSDGTGFGYVIAQLTSEESGHEFVVWTVSRRADDCRWYADNGGYASSLDAAIKTYNERRGFAQEVTVFTLAINTRFGPVSSAHASMDAAKDQLAKYADEWWTAEVSESVDKPADRDKKVEAYFQAVEGREDYEIHESTLTVSAR